MSLRVILIVLVLICSSQALNLGVRRSVRLNPGITSTVSRRYRVQDDEAGKQRWKLTRRFRRQSHKKDPAQALEELAFVKVSSKAAGEALLPPVHGFENSVDEQKQDSSHKTIQARDRSKSGPRLIHNVEDLRKAVLDDGLELRQTKLAAQEAELSVNEVLNHQVIQLIAERFRTKSVPGNRNDNSTLALSIEGGGMRGAVSAGMASAIACLGLCDAFDSVYGSSAGSVVGAYMVSRQMCVDVYTDVLTAAQRAFVCKKRMFAALAASALDLVMTSNGRKFGERFLPGMNISFVLEGIMDEHHGLRPLDIESFQVNDQSQPLRIATSCVKDGKLFAKCLGTNEFFGYVDQKTNETVPAWARADGRRQGLFACLEASMTVPGATGPPVLLVDGNNVTTPSFDAFCFEPLPYRSAVEEGATHVLVLRSRPEGYESPTRPGVYERGVAPLYFRAHGEEEVATFFERGGQQYIYLEDMLTLEEGRLAGIANANEDGVYVPPVDILYGVDPHTKSERLSTSRKDWNKAHLFPLAVPRHVPELSTLEQGKDEVLEAVRGGFAASFDLLAPAIGLELDKGMTGDRVAKLVFPIVDGSDLLSPEDVLKQQVHVRGFSIIKPEEVKRRKQGRIRRAIARRLSRARRNSAAPDVAPTKLDQEELSEDRCHRTDAQTLMTRLPGIQDGRFLPFTNALQYTRSKNDFV